MEFQNQNQDLATYSEKETAAILGVKPATLQSWRWARRGPAYVKVGRLIRYRAADLAEYLEKNRQEVEV